MVNNNLLTGMILQVSSKTLLAGRGLKSISASFFIALKINQTTYIDLLEMVGKTNIFSQLVVWWWFTKVDMVESVKHNLFQTKYWELANLLMTNDPLQTPPGLWKCPHMLSQQMPTESHQHRCCQAQQITRGYTRCRDRLVATTQFKEGDTA